MGLKENVIIGKLIPAATGLQRLPADRDRAPSEPLPRAMDDVGLLDSDEIAAELGLGDGDSLGGFGSAFDEDLASLEEIGTNARRHRLRRRARRLDVPEEGSSARSAPRAMHVVVPRARLVRALGLRTDER